MTVQLPTGAESSVINTVGTVIELVFLCCLTEISAVLLSLFGCGKRDTTILTPIESNDKRITVNGGTDPLFLLHYFLVVTHTSFGQVIPYRF